jgi:Flp pilus assembly protein CpaB
MGVAVAGVASFLVWSYLKRFEDEASGGPKVQVLTVVRTIEPGAVIKDSDIAERGIPVSYVDARAIRSVDRTKVGGLRVTTALDAQQILNWSDIASVNDERIMSSLIQPGMRAVPIHTEGRGSSMARPGDRVDVIATMNPNGTTEHRSGVVLLQNILVLGKTTQSGSAATTTSSCDGADTALSLSLPDAQLLAVAADKAKLSIALRGVDEVRIQGDLKEMSTKDILEPAKINVARPKPAGPQAVGAPK